MACDLVGRFEGNFAAFADAAKDEVRAAAIKSAA